MYHRVFNNDEDFEIDKYDIQIKIIMLLGAE